VKRDIRNGFLSDRKKIITTVAKTRAQIYLKHINPLLNCLDLAILDRSYYTSAVWQSESFDEMYKIISENEKRGIPKADLTFILFASSKTILDRLISRNREDLNDYFIDKILKNQEKYLQLAENLEECIAFNTEREPTELAKATYNLILANNAL
jgi:thymidylate kinase